MSPHVVEVNEGVVEASRQGIEWWQLYRTRFEGTDRIRETKAACVIGGVAEVACESREHADQLAAHMVEHGGLPRTAVRVKRSGAVAGAAPSNPTRED